MQQLSGHDATFLALDTGNSSGHSGAVALLGAGRTLTRADVVAQVEARLPAALCRRLAPVPLGLDLPYWVAAVPDLNVHVQEETLPAGAGLAELAAAVADRHAQRLDRSRPLWELTLISGDEQALYLKIHHAMVDGVGGNDLLLALFGPDAPPPAPPLLSSPSARHLLVRSVASIPGRTGRTVRTVAGVVRRLPDVGAELLRRAPATPLSGPVSPHRQLALVPLDLAEIRKVREALGLTVNDVAVAVTAGALRTWLGEADALPDEPLVAAVPMSLRAAESSGGNVFTLLVAPLPTEVADPRGRALAAAESIRAARAAQGALPPTTLTDLTALAVPALAGPGLGLAARLGLVSRLRPFNLMLSTVPGPREPLTCAGVPITAYYPLSQVAEGQRLNVTMFGYAGALHVGLLADAALELDVERLGELMRTELAALVAA
ncbi:wax ester/triacylglycerol synthase family O-acyltransferase [Sporichthya polymorpha]|uniref:wax ester/triacylglycerol synthase family O-acyltransferase n=1 Tax=Sporichthya polymorpha TaxID=35751 RepID=UPI00037E0EE4|nr:wax ester/triacylglycerol synthase family O-acyltransferase [Sporichthya polymorpha]